MTQPVFPGNGPSLAAAELITDEAAQEVAALATAFDTFASHARAISAAFSDARDGKPNLDAIRAAEAYATALLNLNAEALCAHIVERLGLATGTCVRLGNGDVVAAAAERDATL